MSKPIIVRLPDKLLSRLDATMTELHGVRNQHVVVAVEQYLDKIDAEREIIRRSLESRDRRRKENRS